jgi:hypothetical protein
MADEEPAMADEEPAMADEEPAMADEDPAGRLEGVHPLRLAAACRRPADAGIQCAP